MSKLKVLQFPIANSYGGITHYALDNWKWMDKNRFQCDFATMSKKLDFADEILATGSKIHYISCYAEQNKEQFVKEFDKILDEGYDIVHLHTKQWKSFLVEELCKKHGIPKVIVHAHSTGIDIFDAAKREYEMKEHERVKREFNESLATDFWACSKLAANFLFGDQIPKEKIKIMHNAVELSKFTYNEEIREKYRKEYGLENCYVIGNVARLVYVKNHNFLLEVFSRVVKQIPNAKLLLIGDGELRGQIEKLVKENGIDKNVLLLGKRSDVNNWYQTMDLFVLPSRFEGLAMTFIEAQAAGLPCIGSNHLPTDARILNQAFLLPLNKKLWEQQIIRCSKMQRESNLEELDLQGYDIQKQIQCIEKEYSLSF